MTTNGEHIVLNTKLGKIRGNVIQSNGTRVAQFLGIPYAQQPVGELRFQVLQALDSQLDSDGVPFDATKPGKAAVQNTDNFFATHSEIGEDCITLSIYVPLTGDEIDLENGDLSVIKLPVFMHIHSGGFLIGSGYEVYNDLTNFSGNHQAVGVNFNYRLNLFGFLSYPPWIEHNLGLKDQQFALKWVNENIADFGGEPDNVTLFGCSAGGASVHYHMMSDESSQYFSRGIAISGLINKAWCMEPQDKQRSKVQKTLRRLGCPSHYSGEQVRDYVVNLPLEKFSQFFCTVSIDQSIQFVPVDVFQCSEPTKKNVLLKPLILGICAEEGKFFPDILFPRKDNSMPTKILAEDIQRASESNDQLEDKIAESHSVGIDPSLDGCQSFAFISHPTSDTPKCVVGHGNGAIMVYDLLKSASRNPVQCLKLGSSVGLPVMKVLQHPEAPETVIACSVDGNMYTCNTTKSSSSSVFHKEEGNEPMSMCFVDANKSLVTAGRDTHVRLYDVQTNQIVKAYHGSRKDPSASSSIRTCRPSKKVFCVRTSPSSAHSFFSAGWDNSLKIWDSRTSEGVVQSLSHKNSPHVCGDAIDVKICGGIGLETVLTASWTARRSLQLWDPSQLKLMRSLKFPSTREDGEYLYACRFVSDSLVVAGGSGTKDAVFLNFHTSKPVLAVGDGSRPITAIESDQRCGATLLGGANYDKFHVVLSE